MIALVTTTIHVPHLLARYIENAVTWGHRDVEVIVIGDKKTPPEAKTFCQKLNDTLPCTFVDVEAQEKFLAPLPKLRDHLPYNCIQRRNVGLLWAYARGAEVVITIDDDNFNLGQDFIGHHRQVGVDRELQTYHSSSGWFNVCEALRSDDDVSIYHRGFPWSERWREGQCFVTSTQQTRRCVVNAGFWLDDPDIDALARMHRQPVVRGYKPGWPNQFTLGQHTYSPFNSQNTALARDVIPAYFLTPYAGRYDDIWASYIIMRIASHLNDAIAFGDPWVRQERNPHDLWRDLDQERIGMQQTMDFVSALRAIKLTKSSYHACLQEMLVQLNSAWTLAPSAPESHHTCRKQLLCGLQLWYDAFVHIGDLSPLSRM